MNTIGYFEIQSSDVERDIQFYKAIFGWTFIKNEFVPIEYYNIETKTISGGILKRPAPLPPNGSGTNAFVCSLEVDNFNATSERILSNGGQVAMARFAIPGRCWQGYFLDPDNNTFGIFKANENAK